MIFPGEEIQWEKEKQTTVHASDSKINEKYMAGEVRIVTEQARYPLDTITGMVSSGKYNLMPTFQRRHRWDDEKKSRLIESFIMNVPIPPIFLYEVKFSEYEVMDGLQRLSTICDFYEDKFCLTGLKLWPELNGKRYSELPEMVRQGIDRRYLSSIILLQESAKTAQKAQDMKQLVFERINSGGVKLEPQETRNALYNGPMNELCANLARNKYLCALFRIPNEESYSLLDDEQELPDVAERVEKELENDSVTPEELVRNLHSCFDVASDSYCLNITAFRQHASNFREDSMREFLHNAGICNVDKMISTNKKLKAFLGITSGESVPLSKYFEYLKDLVQRRNIVAHGEMEDNILSSAWLKQYIEYISLLMDSIYDAVLDTYYALMIKNGSAKYLGQPIKTFGDSIVGINSKNTAIKVGHILIARNAEGVLYWGKIESMQINNIPTEEVTAEQAVAIGIKTTFKVKQQYNYYIYWDKYV